MLLVENNKKKEYNKNKGAPKKLLWDIFGTPCNIVTTLGKVEQPELGEDWDQRDVISTLIRYYLKGKAEQKQSCKKYGLLLIRGGPCVPKRISPASGACLNVSCGRAAFVIRID